MVSDTAHAKGWTAYVAAEDTRNFYGGHACHGARIFEVDAEGAGELGHSLEQAGLLAGLDLAEIEV